MPNESDAIYVIWHGFRLLQKSGAALQKLSWRRYVAGRAVVHCLVWDVLRKREPNRIVLVLSTGCPAHVRSRRDLMSCLEQRREPAGDLPEQQ